MKFLNNLGKEITKKEAQTSVLKVYGAPKDTFINLRGGSSQKIETLIKIKATTVILFINDMSTDDMRQSFCYEGTTAHKIDRINAALKTHNGV